MHPAPHVVQHKAAKTGEGRGGIREVRKTQDSQKVAKANFL